MYRLRWYRNIAIFIHPQWGVEQVRGGGMRPYHSPDGSTAPAFFVGAIVRVSIRKNKYNYSN